MTVKQFTNAVDGRITDYQNSVIDDDEFRDSLLDILLKLVSPALLPTTLEEAEAKRWSWAKATFPEATAVGSLDKLLDEIEEVKKDLFTKANPLEEYADCFMCLFDSLQRSGFTTPQLVEAYEVKLVKNKKRSWNSNGNGSYSHIKTLPQ